MHLPVLLLGLSTTVLVLSTGYLGYGRWTDQKVIDGHEQANEQMSADIIELVNAYNADIGAGTQAKVTAADLSQQLEAIVADYTNTSSELATERAQRKASEETNKVLDDVVGQLNSATNKAAELESKARVADSQGKTIDQLVSELNAANEKVGDLEAELAGAKQTSANFSGLVDQLNAANSRIAELEAQLGQ